MSVSCAYPYCWRNPGDIVANVLDYDIVVTEF